MGQGSAFDARKLSGALAYAEAPLYRALQQFLERRPGIGQHRRIG
jgi:hypothetical protein